MRRVGLLTGGGDCPGLNAVIRAVVKALIKDHQVEVLGICDGFEGLVERRFLPLDWDRVSNILTLGGTILGTSNRANPFRYPVKKNGQIVFEDRGADCLRSMQEEGLEALICIGGDGTLSCANEFSRLGVKVLGVPKTIDNDLQETDITFGFDTAVSVATEAIDRLHSTAQAHHRAMVVETMGRNAGWLALYSGVAGGGDILLIPEIPFDIEKVCATVEERDRRGRRYTIVVVGEGARPRGGEQVIQRIVPESFEKVRLGGIGNVVASEIEKRTGKEARAVVLGHLQRAGTPTAFDRVLATRFGGEVARALAERDFLKMVAYKDGKITRVPLTAAVACQKLVPPDHDLIRIARSIGTTFGD